jgi:hypothetical protein
VDSSQSLIIKVHGRFQAEAERQKARRKLEGREIEIRKKKNPFPVICSIHLSFCAYWQIARISSWML